MFEPVRKNHIVKLVRLQFVAYGTRDNPLALKGRGQARQWSCLNRKKISEPAMFEIDGYTAVLEIYVVDEADQLFLRYLLLCRRRTVRSGGLKIIISFLSAVQAYPL